MSGRGICFLPPVAATVAQRDGLRVEAVVLSPHPRDEGLAPVVVPAAFVRPNELPQAVGRFGDDVAGSTPIGARQHHPLPDTPLLPPIGKENTVSKHFNPPALFYSIRLGVPYIMSRPD